MSQKNFQSQSQTNSNSKSGRRKTPNMVQIKSMYRLVWSESQQAEDDPEPEPEDNIEIPSSSGRTRSGINFFFNF